MHAQLRRDGIRVSRKRVERLMRAHGLKGAFARKRWRCSTRQNPKATPAPDLVKRQFTAPAPNRLWVADLERHEARTDREEVQDLLRLAVAAAG